MRSRRRRHRIGRKRFWEYSLPLTLSLAIALGVTYGVNTLVSPPSAMVLGESSSIMSSFVTAGDSVELHLGKNKNKVAQGYKVSLSRGEGMSTSSSREFLPLSNMDLLRLDAKTTFRFADQQNVVVELESGRAWLHARKESKSGYTSVAMSMIAAEVKEGVITAEKRGGKEIIEVFEGEIEVEVMNKKGSVSGKRLLKEGQRLEMTEDLLVDMLADQDLKLAKVIPPSTFSSEWVTYNTKEDQKIIGTVEAIASTVAVPSWVRGPFDELEETYLTVERESLITNQDALKVSGLVADEVLEVYVGTEPVTIVEGMFELDLPLREEGETEVVVAYKLQDGRVGSTAFPVIKDTIPPKISEIVAPAGSSTSSTFFALEGTAEPDVVKVTVNGYELTKFQKGNATWKYFISANGGNIRPGQNTYRIVLTDHAGNVSEEKAHVLTWTGTVEAPAASEEE